MGVGNRLVASGINLLSFTGTALVRRDIAQRGVKMRRVVPVNEIGVPGSRRVRER